VIISSPRGARNSTVHTHKATGSDAIRLTAKQSRKVKGLSLRPIDIFFKPIHTNVYLSFIYFFFLCTNRF